MPHLPPLHHPHRRPTSHIPKRQTQRPMPHLQMGNQHPQTSHHHPPLRALQPNLWPLRAHAQTPSNRQIQRPVYELQEATTDRPACTSRPRPRPQTLPSSPPCPSNPPRPSNRTPHHRQPPPPTPYTPRPPGTATTPPHHGINHHKSTGPTGTCRQASTPDSSQTPCPAHHKSKNGQRVSTNKRGNITNANEQHHRRNTSQ